MTKILIREARSDDEPLLVSWLSQEGVLKWFPLTDLREIEDAAKIWLSYCKQNAVLTAECDGVPCGIANLYIQPFKKFSHQCLFAIIVDENFRGRGVGTKLIESLEILAKERFDLKILHLEVYEENPAINLYRKLGFEEFGKQRRFIKEESGYRSKIFMQKRL